MKVYLTYRRFSYDVAPRLLGVCITLDGAKSLAARNERYPIYWIYGSGKHSESLFGYILVDAVAQKTALRCTDGNWSDYIIKEEETKDSPLESLATCAE